MSNNEISVPPAEQIDEAGDWMGPVQSVPPAGGEPEVLGRMQGCYITPLQSIPDGTELVDRAHVTRLQAAVELWKGRTTNLSIKNADLRAELDALKAAQGDVRPVAYMRNEGTPNNLVKCTFTCPGAFGVYRHPAQPQGEPVAYTTVGMVEIAKRLPLTGRIGAKATKDARWNVPLHLRPVEQPRSEPVAQKYDNTLLPFLALMRKELHANVGKGDRPGWLAMSSDTCLLEIFYHLGKLQKAVKNSDTGGMTEYAADVANMCMMLLDICGAPAFVEPPAPVADEDWHMNPCKQGHRDVGAAGGVASCYQCDEKITATTTQEAFKLWNAAHPKP
ncbi:hypothetical protein ACVNP3_18960 [Pseudomonas chlororaphis subsp. piscium]